MGPRPRTAAEEERARLVLTGISETDPTDSYGNAEKEGDFEISVLDFWLPCVEPCPCARDCAQYLKYPISFNLLGPHKVVLLAPFFWIRNLRGEVTCPRSRNGWF